MKIGNYLIGLLSAGLSWGSLLGQQPDSIFHLPEVSIQAEQIRENTVGSLSTQWDKAQIQEFASMNLADLLQEAGGIYIKGYGLGSLSTSSIRGGSAGHTLLLWNGMPLSSPMLGQLDLALIPVGSTESIRLEKGGNTALWGSGAIGGLVALSAEVVFENRFQVHSQTVGGSWGQFQQQGGLELGNEKWQSHTKFIHQQAQNDFSYELGPGIPKRKQENASLSQQNLFQDLYWKPNSQNQLALHFWRQESQREIPPTNVQTRSEAKQEDKATRMILSWTHQQSGHQLQAKASLFDESLLFTDPMIGLVAPSNFRTYMGELGYQRASKNGHIFHLGSTIRHTQAHSNGYNDAQEESRNALFSSWKWQSGKWKIQSSLRQEWVDGRSIPLVPSLGWKYALLPSLSFQGKISRNYRLPTLNDRFWRPGGNPELLPESGWSQEATLNKKINGRTIDGSFSLTGFNRHIDNWILWSIREGQSFWSANNITQVWSRGLEARTSFMAKVNGLQIGSQLGYDYIRSTNQVALEAPRMEAGQQLLYTPEHQSFGNLSLQGAKWKVSYAHRFVGKARGINEAIPAFDVATLRMQYTDNYRSIPLRFFVELHNLWNQSYFIIERRPMPGLQVQAGLHISFNQHTSS